MLLKKFLLLILLTLGVTVADQGTKYAAVCNLSTAVPSGPEDTCSNRFWSTLHPRPTGRVSVIGQVVQFVYVENPGAAWGLGRQLSGPMRRVVFLVVAFFAMIFMAYYYHRTPTANWRLRAALGLVMGGALGNFIDRARMGYVVDFIRVDLGFWPVHPWPLWNIADAGITIGVIAILIDGLFLQPKEAKE